jgi:hypothetical protein
MTDNLPALGAAALLGAAGYMYYSADMDKVKRKKHVALRGADSGKAIEGLDPGVYKKNAYVPLKTVLMGPDMKAKDLQFVGTYKGGNGLVKYRYYIPATQCYTTSYTALGYWR